MNRKIFIDANFENQRLPDDDYRDSYWLNCNLKNADGSGYDFTGATFEGETNLEGFDFTNAILLNVSIGKNVKLKNIKLTTGLIKKAIKGLRNKDTYVNIFTPTHSYALTAELIRKQAEKESPELAKKLLHWADFINERRDFCYPEFLMIIDEESIQAIYKAFKSFPRVRDLMLHHRPDLEVKEEK